MTDDHDPLEPTRPGQCHLDDAICDVIKRHFHEWDLTQYDVVGVLTMIAARYAHMSIEHDGDEVG